MAAELSQFLRVDQMKHKYEKTVFHLSITSQGWNVVVASINCVLSRYVPYYCIRPRHPQLFIAFVSYLIAHNWPNGLDYQASSIHSIRCQGLSDGCQQALCINAVRTWEQIKISLILSYFINKKYLEIVCNQRI